MMKLRGLRGYKLSMLSHKKVLELPFNPAHCRTMCTELLNSNEDKNVFSRLALLQPVEMLYSLELKDRTV